MNFQNIVKEEWEKEFISQIGEYEGCILQVYESLLERFCKRVWNQALEVAADNANADINCVTEECQHTVQELFNNNQLEVFVLKESILKHKI